jgi:hypothetical protein
MTVTENGTFQKLRRDCYDAMALSFVSEPDISPVLDNIFDIVGKALRLHFGIGFQDTALILADARNEAERLIGRYHLDDFVNLDEAVDAIAEYLAEPPVAGP